MKYMNLSRSVSSSCSVWQLMPTYLSMIYNIFCIIFMVIYIYSWSPTAESSHCISTMHCFSYSYKNKKVDTPLNTVYLFSVGLEPSWKQNSLFFITIWLFWINFSNNNFRFLIFWTIFSNNIFRKLSFRKMLFYFLNGFIMKSSINNCNLYFLMAYWINFYLCCLLPDISWIN